MKPINFDRATRVCGESQGYIGLPIMDTATDYGNVMTSIWQPDGDEIEALINGACISVHVRGNNPQPINLGVGYK